MLQGMYSLSNVYQIALLHCRRVCLRLSTQSKGQGARGSETFPSHPAHIHFSFLTYTHAVLMMSNYRADQRNQNAKPHVTLQLKMKHLLLGGYIVTLKGDLRIVGILGYVGKNNAGMLLYLHTAFVYGAKHASQRSQLWIYFLWLVCPLSDQQG